MYSSIVVNSLFFFFSSRRRHTRWNCDWSSDVCSSDLPFRVRHTLLAWAQKEYKNLVRMGDAGVRVPNPERVLDNVLVMEYIGDETQPAPSLREIALEDPHAVFNDVVANMRGIRESELVHADLSEYNLLWWAGQVVVIDVGQAVTLDHPRAAEWFKRDVANVARFFKRRRVDVTPATLERAILEG